MFVYNYNLVISQQLGSHYSTLPILEYYSIYFIDFRANLGKLIQAYTNCNRVQVL